MINCMMRLATRLTALLITFLFLGATSQCAVVCLQPQQHDMPCHQHGPPHTACARTTLTAERATAAQAPAPVMNVFPVGYLPVPQLPVHSEPVARTLSVSPSLKSLKATVLLI
jgi:hypothetical protein